MPGVRSKDKKRIEGWLPAELVDRVTAAAADLEMTLTGVLNEALGDWADAVAPPESEGP